MAAHVGWRSFFWLNVALLGFTLVLLVFLFPETKWQRNKPEESTQTQTDLHTPDTNGSASEKQAEAKQAKQDKDEECDSDPPADPFLGRGSPSKRQFMLWTLDGSDWKALLYPFWTPWKLLAYPIVELAAFNVSWSASVFLTVNLTQLHAFGAPPYNFNSETIGFFNFALLIGAIIGLFTNGPLSDWISMRATKKNRGIREPEMRLPTLIPYIIISTLGNFIVAFGYEYHWDWRVSSRSSSPLHAP
jgi:MFS family permease